MEFRKFLQVSAAVLIASGAYAKDTSYVGSVQVFGEASDAMAVAPSLSIQTAIQGKMTARLGLQACLSPTAARLS